MPTGPKDFEPHRTHMFWRRRRNSAYPCTFSVHRKSSTWTHHVQSRQRIEVNAWGCRQRFESSFRLTVGKGVPVPNTAVLLRLIPRAFLRHDIFLVRRVCVDVSFDGASEQRLFSGQRT